MARMKFLCDAERCIECNACVTACKNEHEVPWGVNRRRVVTIQDGKPGERSISVACMHCSDAPCMAVCPVDCFYQTDQGVVLHSKDLCIGCGYCFYACPFGAPQFGSFFFMITGFHGTHVSIGVIFLFIYAYKVFAGHYDERKRGWFTSMRGDYVEIEILGLYWHFVDLVWVFIFAFFYLW